MLNLRKVTIIATFLLASNLLEAKTVVQEGYIVVQNNASNTNYHSIHLIDTHQRSATVQFPFQNRSSWVFSGLAGGQYRVELVNDVERHVLTEFKVEHYSIAKALWFFLLGLAMFASLIWRLLSFDHRSDTDS